MYDIEYLILKNSTIFRLSLFYNLCDSISIYKTIWRSRSIILKKLYIFSPFIRLLVLKIWVLLPKRTTYEAISLHAHMWEECTQKNSDIFLNYGSIKSQSHKCSWVTTGQTFESRFAKKRKKITYHSKLDKVFVGINK